MNFTTPVLVEGGDFEMAKLVALSPGLHSLARNSAYLSAGQILTQIIRAVYIVLLARALGPSLYGILAYIQAWYLTFLPVALLGLAAVIPREVGRGQQNKGFLLNTSFSLRICSSVFAALICILLGIFIEEGNGTSTVLIIFGIALIGRALAMWSEHVFIAHEVSRFALRQNVIFRPLEATVGSVVVGIWPDVILVAVIHALTWWLQAFFSFRLVVRRIYQAKPEWHLPEFKTLLAAGLPLTVSSVLSGWLLQGPLVLARHTIPEGDPVLGQLAVAYQGLILAMAIPWAIGTAALPILSRSAERADSKDVAFLDGMFRVSFLLGSLAGILGMAIGPWILPIVFGDGYGYAGTLFGIALWLLIPLTLAVTSTNTLVAHGDFKTPPLAAFSGALLLLIFHDFLYQNYGILGNLFSAALGIWAWALIVALVVAYRVQLSLRKTIIRPALVSIASLAVIFVLGGESVVLASMVAFVVLFFLSFMLGVIPVPARADLK